MKQYTTGPAFPTEEFVESRPLGDQIVIHQGLTKREYFAGLAMQGFASDPETTWPTGVNGMARCAYEWADAMIAEGKK